MKLTAHQLKFIDNYLKYSGIEFMDIRYEMADHIASALEERDGDFYDEFKDYMRIHKAELLQSNRKFLRLATEKAYNRLFANAVKPWAIALVISLFLLLFLFKQYIPLENLSEDIQLAATVLFIAVIGSVFHKRLFRGNRFSVTAKLTSSFALLLYVCLVVIRVDKLLAGTILLPVYYTLMIFMMIVLMITNYQQERLYKLKYN